MRSMLVWLMVLSGGAFPPAKLPTVPSAPAQACQPAELFITDNTDPLFEIQADATIAQNGALATGSTALEGVYWSTELQQTTSERSREFHLCSPDELTLHAVAAALLRQFHQEAVLTFDYLPEHAPGADAIASSISAGSTRKPRTFTWPSSRPRNSRTPSGRKRARSPVR